MTRAGLFVACPETRGVARAGLHTPAGELAGARVTTERVSVSRAFLIDSRVTARGRSQDMRDAAETCVSSVAAVASGSWTRVDRTVFTVVRAWFRNGNDRFGRLEPAGGASTSRVRVDGGRVVRLHAARPWRRRP